MNNLEQQTQELMLSNQPLKAWELVKNTDYPLRDAVYAKVRHAFDPKEYQKYYREDLEEVSFPKQFTFGCDRIVPRYSWLMQILLKRKIENLLDIGCGSGELGLTLGILDLPSTGLNLYNPSVEYANKLAKEKNINHVTKFINIDFFDYNQQHDVVVMFDLLEHLPNPARGIERAFSLVKSGGSLFLSTPLAGEHEGIRRNRWVQKPNSWNDQKISGHLRLFSEQELRALLKDYVIGEFALDITKNMLVKIQK